MGSDGERKRSMEWDDGGQEQDGERTRGKKGEEA